MSKGPTAERKTHHRRIFSGNELYPSKKATKSGMVKRMKGRDGCANYVQENKESDGKTSAFLPDIESHEEYGS